MIMMITIKWWFFSFLSFFISFELLSLLSLYMYEIVYEYYYCNNTHWLNDEIRFNLKRKKHTKQNKNKQPNGFNYECENRSSKNLSINKTQTWRYTLKKITSYLVSFSFSYNFLLSCCCRCCRCFFYPHMLFWVNEIILIQFLSLLFFQLNIN